jgi:hypothetical protein
MKQKSFFLKIIYTAVIVGVTLFFVPMPTSPIQAQQAPSPGDESSLHDMRSQEQVTSGTKILKQKNESELGDGVITFEDLKKTILKSQPPPKYQESLNKLDGENVTVRGFMTPFDSLTNFKHFMIFPNATGCQFCAVPSPKEVVFVRLKDEYKDQEFIPDPIEVTGTLSLWKEGKDQEDEAHKSFLYVMNDAKVVALSDRE